jgi:hypothetical protein
MPSPETGLHFISICMAMYLFLLCGEWGRVLFGPLTGGCRPSSLRRDTSYNDGYLRETYSRQASSGFSLLYSRRPHLGCTAYVCLHVLLVGAPITETHRCGLSSPFSLFLALPCFNRQDGYRCAILCHLVAGSIVTEIVTIC